MKITISWVGEVKLTKTKFGDKNKFSVKTQEEGDKFLDVWLKPNVPTWKVGEVHEIEGITPREYNGKTYYSVKFAGKNKNLEEVENRITKIELRLATLENQLKPQPIKYPEGEPSTPNFEPDEVPF